MKQIIDPVTKIISDPLETKSNFDLEFVKYLRKLEKRRNFKKQSKVFAKKFFKGLLVTGVICVAATFSPYFLTNLIKALMQYGMRELEKEERKVLSDMFSYYARKGMINIRTSGKQIYISLTKEGKKLAKHYQIDDLEIKKPKTWDGKLRILIFDIPEKTRIKREALRGKLKELGFLMLQKSVWIHPYPCESELKILQTFFAFRSHHYLFFETENIGESQKYIVSQFGLG